MLSSILVQRELLFHMFNAIELPNNRTRAQISGLNNYNVCVCNNCIFVLVSTFDHNFELTIAAFMILKLSGNLPSHSISTSPFKYLQNISLADSNFYKSSQLDLLIDSDVLPP